MKEKKITGCSVKKHWPAVVLTLILLLQLLFMCYLGDQKSGYHLDEMYTYSLANYDDAFLTRTSGFMESWQSGSFFVDAISASNENRFDYAMVYENQVSDVHPPLYYYVIHTAASLFPGTFSKWIGIVPNIFFCLLTTIVLFFASKNLLKSDFSALLATCFWAFGVGAMNTVTFIRMYALLTLFCTLLVLLHLKAWKETSLQKNLSWKKMLLLFLCTFGGALTQYYFLIFCFFLCGIFFAYLMISKQWKNLLKYLLAEIGAVTAAILYYPAMLTHLFSSYRGKEALSNLSAEGYAEKLEKAASVVSRELSNGWGEEILLAVLLIVVVIAACRRFLHFSAEKGENGCNLRIDLSLPQRRQILALRISEKTLLLCALVLVAIGYFCVIAKIAPYQDNRYYMNIFPLLALIFAAVLYDAIHYLFQRPAFARCFVAVFFVFLLAAGYSTQNVTYVYSRMSPRSETLAPYRDIPVIVLNGASYDSAPDRWLYEYPNYSAVFRCKHDDFSGLSLAKDTGALSNGFLLYADHISLTDEELFAKVEEHMDVETFEKVTNIGCPVYFCTLEESQ